MARASPGETFYAEVMSCDDHIGLDQHARVMVTIGYGKWAVSGSNRRAAGPTSPYIAAALC